MSPNDCTPWSEWDGIKGALAFSRTSLLSIPEKLKWHHWAKGSSSRIPILCSSWRSVAGIMKKPRDGFACHVKGFLAWGKQFCACDNFPKVRNNKEWVRLWGMDKAFYIALPAESNWKKQSGRVFSVKDFHGCSESTDRLMALQHEIIAPMPTNATCYLLVQTVGERRNNLAQCSRSKIDFWIATG